ncbi:MAG: STAS domain-containing protein [Chloroflexia bacterium]|nr:STAS domain-containing protein [Chloroflexia bacterium]
MELSTERIDTVTLIKLCGDVDANTARDLEQTLSEEQAADHHQLILDMSEVDYVSSAGLRALLGGLKVARSSGGDLRLAALQEPVREVFDISGFSTLFEIFADRQAGLESFLVP